MLISLCVASAALGVALVGDVSGPLSVSAPERTADGLLTHTVQSPYQSQPTRLVILLPENLRPEERCRALYVLPVEAGDSTHWGEPLAELRRLGLHNQYRLACVYPTFAQLPWYADHPRDPGIRQESHLLQGVLPWIESHYPVHARHEARLLLGFSKSGWGAFSLLLRHPDCFARAAAWASPLEESTPQRFGMGPVFGTPENFENYRTTSLLTRYAGQWNSGPPRLVLLGYGNFQAAVTAAHQRLNTLQIAHVYRDGPARKHHWNSGWLQEAVTLLAAETPSDPQ